MPDLSVIIATYNRAASLRACLHALAQQTHPLHRFEVVVVNDGSTDDTPSVVRDMGALLSLRPVGQSNRGQAAALNVGIQVARAAYCLFLDDDIMADPDLVAEHFRAHHDRESAVVIGQLTLRVPDTAGWYVKAYARSWAAHYANLNEGRRQPGATDCFSGNLSVPRDALVQVGGFDTELKRGFDIELGLRLAQAGLIPHYVPAALGHQVEHKGMADLTQDAEREGASALALLDRHPEARSEAVGSYHHSGILSAALQWVGLTFSLSPRILAWVIAFTGKRDDRAFRFIRHYAFWRGVRRTVPDRGAWRQITSGTCILMYHAFGRINEPASTYVIPGRRFRQQLRWLRRLGWPIITLQQYVECRLANHPPPGRSVVLTIDDGYVDAAAVAAPILKEHGVNATLFLVTRRMGGANDWSVGDELAGRDILSWPTARDLASPTMGLGAHTRSHPRLPTLPEDVVRQEVLGSKLDIERETGTPARAFAYPYGESDPATEAIVRAAGFDAVCGIEPGVNSCCTDLQELRRIEIFGTDPLPVFLVKVWLGRSHLPRLPGWRRVRGQGGEKQSRGAPAAVAGRSGDDPPGR